MWFFMRSLGLFCVCMDCFACVYGKIRGLWSPSKPVELCLLTPSYCILMKDAHK